MIQKISSSEYLKRVDNMTAAERKEYQKRVGVWLRKHAPALMRKAEDPSAIFQDAVQCSARWNDDVCLAWHEGAQLLTALAGKEDTWLPDMLYVKAAKRAIKKMADCLTASFQNIRLNVQDKPSGSGQLRMEKEDSAEGVFKTTQAVAVTSPVRNPQDTVRNGQTRQLPATPACEQAAAVAGIPVRPKHIDQYVHLLPENTQKKAAMVQGLLRDLDVARENARLLMNDPKTKSDSIAQWARTATALDTKVKTIYRELDAEWEKLVQSGRIVVDDLGNARIIPPDGHATEPENEQNPELTPEEKALIKSLRSWLRDTRGPKEDGEKHDAYVVRWKEKYREMTALGGKGTVTDAVVKSAELYGIDINSI